MTKLNSSFMIGNVEIPHRTVLAPMAGVTNSAFRTIAKEFGAGLVVMEMISEKGLLYNNEKTLHMLHIDENEHPMSIQLFGGDAEGLKRAADFIQTNTKADIVDINMGCPVNKVDRHWMFILIKMKQVPSGSRIQIRFITLSRKSRQCLIFL